MPRFVVRKSSLSSAHYCRRWLPGNPSKTPRRKAEDYENPYGSYHYPLPPDEEFTTDDTRCALIAGGARVLLRQCSLSSRIRLLFIVFLIIFFTWAFLEFFGSYDEDLLEIDFPEDALQTDKRRPYHQPPRHQPKFHLSHNITSYQLSRPNCSALSHGDDREISRIKRMLYREVRVPLRNNFFVKTTANCSQFRSSRGYSDKAPSDYEANYPIAYLVGVKEYVELVERLIRATYAPQNVYCLYGVNSTSFFERNDLVLALMRISSCLTNVIVMRDADNKSQSTVLYKPGTPYLPCLEKLLQFKWKFALLTAEGDFPLTTNSEIVDSVRHSANIWRLNRKSSHSRLLPPLTENNDYSGYMITRKMAEQVTQGLADFNLATVNETREDKLVQEMTGLLNLKIRFNKPCLDREEQECVLNSSDLRWLLRQPYLFARKFDLRTDYVIVNCLEKKLDKQKSDAKNMN